MTKGTLEYKRNGCDAECVKFALSAFSSDLLRSHARGQTAINTRPPVCSQVTRTTTAWAPLALERC